MKFCKVCESFMVKEVHNNKIMFVCHCGEYEQGQPDDHCILFVKLGQSSNNQLYGSLIKSAKYDRTVLLVDKKCSKCGKSYMKHISTPVNEISYYVCECGEVTQ